MSLFFGKYRWPLCLLSGFLGGISVLSPSLFSSNDPPEQTEENKELVEQAAFYRSPEERREAGLGTPITEWLTFYGLVEGEYEYEKEKFRDGFSFSEDLHTQAIQIGLEAEFNEWIFGEFVYEIEHDRKWRSILEEAILEFDFDTWAIKAGVQYVQFGEYYSYFVTGPMLEVGETRNPSIMIDRELNEQTELTLYLFDEDGIYARHNPGWGAAIEWASEDESVRFGSGIISNIAQSDDFQDEEDYLTPVEVPGWNFYALAGFDTFEVTVEGVVATGYFELEEERLRPEAYNAEIAYFLKDEFQLGARLEYSRDLIDEPDWQYGVVATWRAGQHFLVSVDYLHGSYNTPLVIEEDEEYLKTRHIISAQVALEF